MPIEDKKDENIKILESKKLTIIREITKQKEKLNKSNQILASIEPELKDMIIAGYDSYREYMEGLRFTMLCVEYTFKDIEYKVLVSDARLKRLLKTHVE